MLELKAALSVLGLPGERPRRPRLPASEEQKAEVAWWLANLDIRGSEGLV
jgi:dihydrodipicolinate synthase/N-acetylneuraminate lyase